MHELMFQAGVKHYYRILAGKFGGELNLALWRIDQPTKLKIRQYLICVYTYVRIIYVYGIDTILGRPDHPPARHIIPTASAKFNARKIFRLYYYNINIVLTLQGIYCKRNERADYIAMPFKYFNKSTTLFIIYI